MSERAGTVPTRDDSIRDVLIPGNFDSLPGEKANDQPRVLKGTHKTGVNSLETTLYPLTPR